MMVMAPISRYEKLVYHTLYTTSGHFRRRASLVPWIKQAKFQILMESYYPMMIASMSSIMAHCFCSVSLASRADRGCISEFP